MKKLMTCLACTALLAGSALPALAADLPVAPAVEEQTAEAEAQAQPYMDNGVVMLPLRAVGALPVRYREVVHLFYYEDLTTAEIAALLGEREEAVRKRLSRARAQLRDVLKERGEPDGTL